MAGVFLNNDPPPPSPPGECVSPAFGAGEDTLAGWRGGGSIFWKKTGTALYSTYVSTLWGKLLIRHLAGGIMTGSGATPPCPRRTRRGRPRTMLLPLMMVLPSRYR
jgi:hypothetical protein